jgi:phosphoribosylaminoimidazole-succinocarboxamide synthase
MTSVKEFVVDRDPTPDRPGRGRFVFTDGYSVFDWGTMPDTIPSKGECLCTMGAFNFELLDINHVPTHYEGVLEDADAGADATVKELGECERPPRGMAIELVHVPELPYEDGDYDYDAYYDAAGEHYLIPLEIVFRNVVPEGSSLRDRRDPGEFGLDDEEWPDEAVSLPEPVVEFSTKYEEQDRYLGPEEADRIAGRAALDRLEELALAVNHVVTDRADRAGFVHEDGKIECLYRDGVIQVADVVGTFDENRFSYDGQEVSKEVVRQYHGRRHPEWVDAVAAAKAEARERGVADWRSLCAVDAPGLPDDVRRTVAEMYAAGTNAYTGSEWFDVPDVEAAVAAVRDL